MIENGDTSIDRGGGYNDEEVDYAISDQGQHLTRKMIQETSQTTRYQTRELWLQNQEETKRMDILVGKFQSISEVCL